uniref:Uncharacterized protein n=1 Tax=Anguilla anguilla TaxID=7936 RepID=A0A0E9WX25_ANGAN
MLMRDVFTRSANTEPNNHNSALEPRKSCFPLSCHPLLLLPFFSLPSALSSSSLPLFPFYSSSVPFSLRFPPVDGH